MNRSAAGRVTLLVFGIGLTLIGKAALADEIRYLAWNGPHARATIGVAGTTRSVAIGDSIPGFGTVITLDEWHMVLRRFLSEAERADLESRGFIGHRANQVEVVREDLRFHGIPSE